MLQKFKHIFVYEKNITLQLFFQKLLIAIAQSF